MGSLEQALNAFHQVTDANSDIFAKARLAVADIFSQDADSRQAVESYRKIADGIPDYRRDALVKIAKIAVQRDDVQEALTAYQEALDAGKGRSGISDAELIFAAADLYELQNQHQRAVEEYLKIPYLHQEETVWVIRAYLRAARILENSENWDEAAVAYEKVIALDAEESAYARERLDEIQSYVQGKH